jgi:lipopolysaccharide export system protein LptA
LLGGAGFLVLVIVAFLGSARYLRHRLQEYLPEKLAANVKIDSTGVSWCDTVGSKTVYCIHAAKELEHADEKFVLHDVSITLYGEKQDRNDRIYGDEFEYDQKAGVVRATGLVHIDLQSADAGGGHDSAASAKVLHVTTSGLVYLEKLGVAATNDYVEFQSGALTGHATGADYSRDSGVLTMHSAVSMSGGSGKRAMEVTAATADFDNLHQEAFLTNARYVAQGQTVEAQRATLHRRPDGTLARVEAEGNVTIEANGGTEVSQRADVALNAAGQPQSALLTGGVRYSDDQPLRQLRGEAQEATIAFDAQAKPQPKDAVFSGAVHMIERTRATQTAKEPWSTRDLTAAKVETRLAPAGAGTSQLRDVDAAGSAHLTVESNGSLASARGAGTTELAADDLKAHLIDAKNGRQPPRLDTVAGRGHTLLRQVTADGTEQTSTGDMLDAKFRPWSTSRATLNSVKTRPAGAAVGGPSHEGASRPAGGEGVDDLWSAVQHGHVSMMRLVPAKSGAKAGTRPVSAQKDVERASAERAEYDGDLDRVTLSGGVQMSDAGSVLWANQVASDRKTGDAQAVGAVKVNYAQENSAQGGGGHATAPVEPTHVIADRAELVHATSAATFYGKPVRLWQGGSQVQAPVIQLQRTGQRMIARSGSATEQVHTILTSTGNDAAGTAKSGAGAKAAASKQGTGTRLPGVVRIASGGLVYSGDLREAEFSGGVRAETVDGTIRASEATIYLQPAGTAQSAGTSAANAVPSLAGDVEHMVATGQVVIEQPGRRATGERLVYTASDKLFMLTGDGKAMPRLVDSARGTIAGAVLQFHMGDNSVAVFNGTPGATGAAAGQKVRIETRVDKDATMGKGK